MTNSAPVNEAGQREKLRKILNDSHTAFMVTHSGSTLHGRPMANAEVDETFHTLWFASSRVSGKIAELQANSEVCLGYTNTSGSEWASIVGTATVVDDRAKIHELWSPFWKNWFDSADDPNLVLIAVTPLSADYWDSGSKMVAWLKFAVAAATGKKLSAGENGHVDLAGQVR